MSRELLKIHGKEVAVEQLRIHGYTALVELFYHSGYVKVSCGNITVATIMNEEKKRTLIHDMDGWEKEMLSIREALILKMRECVKQKHEKMKN